jgi:NDP-sugar pyrophosphorylase family protein
MQAVILAAGKGTRMGALTETRPKPMLEVGGKTLLEHKFETLPYDVDEVIIIVGYLGSVIHDHFGGVWRDKRILYVEQENPSGGTADALWQAKDVLRDHFLVMNGDNLYAREDVTRCAVYDWSVLVQERDDVQTGRVIVKDGLVTDIRENSEHDSAKGFANTGLYSLDMRVFDYPQLPKAMGSPELGLPQTMLQAIGTIPIHAVPATFWLEIKTPEDLAEAEELMRTNS